MGCDGGKRPCVVVGGLAVEVQAYDIRTRRALEQAPALRSYTQTNYAAKSWKGERRV
jgi:hypothetical protein